MSGIKSVIYICNNVRVYVDEPPKYQVPNVGDDYTIDHKDYRVCAVKWNIDHDKCYVTLALK